MISSFSCSLRFFRRDSGNWSGLPVSRQGLDGGVQVAMLLRQLGQLGARGDFIGIGNRSFIAAAFFRLAAALGNSSPQRFTSGQS